MGLVTVAAYTWYVIAVLGRAGDSGSALADVSYQATLLWTIIGAIVTSIIAHIAVSILFHRGEEKPDERDRDIYRFGEYIGQWLVLAGATAALGLAMLEVRHFWIANVIYLAFVLGAVLSSALKIFAYRRGLPRW